MKVILVTLAAFALGLGLLPATAGSSSIERSSVKRVSAYNNYFSPKTVKVRRGGKVVWKIREGIHNIRGSGMNSANIRKGGTYSKKFKRRGSYRYTCTLHLGMTGTVKVR
jgi:plastocyanin